MKFLSKITGRLASLAVFVLLLGCFAMMVPAHSDAEAVSIITSEQTENYGLALHWNAIAGADGYEILWNHNTDSSTLESLNTTLTLDHLIPGATYNFAIRSFQLVNGQRAYGEYSPMQSATVAVSQVKGLAVAATGSSITAANVSLNWDAMGEASYEVSYKTDQDADYQVAGVAPSNSYVADGLLPNTHYTFRVRAIATNPVYTGEYSETVEVTTCPLAMSNVIVASATTDQIVLAWDQNTSATRYMIYRGVGQDGELTYYTSTDTTAFTDTGLQPGTVYRYAIAAMYDPTSQEGPRSSEVTGVTSPTQVTGLSVTAFGSDSLTLNWQANPSATGYLIYRKDSKTSYTLVGTTMDSSYIDLNLASGTYYRYYIIAYAVTNDHASVASDIVRVSTRPAIPVVKGKAGTNKLRISWPAITGASGYQIYRLQEDGQVVLLDTLESAKATSQVYTDLENGVIYSYKVYAYKKATNVTAVAGQPATEMTLVSDEPLTTSVTPAVAARTSTTAYLYKNKSAFKKSAAWKNLAPVMQKAFVYNKSAVVPGISVTDVNGFNSKNMCLQGMCVTPKYILVAAYDQDYEENSVIYVIKKSTRKLRTVIVLENQTHAGGLCYLDDSVWVTQGSKLCNLSYAKIDEAAKAGQRYSVLNYEYTCDMSSKASFATAYNGMIWVGSYNSSAKGELYGYTVNETGDETIKTLTPTYHTAIPSRVQGLAFDKKGRLWFSRAYSKTHELNVYKPVLNARKKTMTLRSRKKVFSVPYLSQGIAFYNNYLYVDFESALAPKSPDHIDRVLAFKWKKIYK